MRRLVERNKFAIVCGALVLGVGCQVEDITEGASDDEPAIAEARAACNDRLDNDGDGAIDYPADPGCASKTDHDETDVAAPPKPQCSDGINNDSSEDAWVDYPNDPGCTDANDNTELGNPPPTSSGDCADTGRTGWTLMVCDAFDGNALDLTKWGTYGDTDPSGCWPGHSGNGLRCSSQVSVSNGKAVITAEMSGGVLRSGAFDAEPAYRIQYGRYETRVRVDDDPSTTMSAVVLNWNVDTTAHPSCDGEADFYETGRGAGLNSVKSFLHYEQGTPNCSDATTQTYMNHSVPANVWHDITLEWTPDVWKVCVDGVCRAETDPTKIPQWAQKTVWQLDAFGTSLPAPVRMEVAYARIYRYAP
jgi:hypothetical protein